MNASKISISRKLAKEIINSEQDKMIVDICGQAKAELLCTMEFLYGWKGKRLRKLLHAMQEFTKMQSEGVRGAEFDAFDCAEHLHKQYGINVFEDILIKSDDKKDSDTIKELKGRCRK